MKQIKFTLSGANGKNIGSFPVSEKFISESHRLNAPSEIIVQWLLEEFAENPPCALAILRGYGSSAHPAELAAV